jgi:hypothetical protein
VKVAHGWTFVISLKGQANEAQTIPLHELLLQSEGSASMRTTVDPAQRPQKKINPTTTQYDFNTINGNS